MLATSLLPYVFVLCTRCHQAAHGPPCPPAFVLMSMVSRVQSGRRTFGRTQGITSSNFSGIGQRKSHLLCLRRAARVYSMPRCASMSDLAHSMSGGGVRRRCGAGAAAARGANRGAGELASATGGVPQWKSWPTKRRDLNGPLDRPARVCNELNIRSLHRTQPELFL